MKSKQKLVRLAFLTALVLALGSSAPTQEQRIPCKDVPPAVHAAFAAAFPKATIKVCSKEMDKGQMVYEIQSVEGKTTRDIIYSAGGKLVLAEESVNLSELPPEVKDALDKKFPAAKILRAEKVTKGSVVGYEFRIEHMGKTTEIVFDPKGNELKL